MFGRSGGRVGRWREGNSGAVASNVANAGAPVADPFHVQLAPLASVTGQQQLAGQ